MNGPLRAEPPTVLSEQIDAALASYVPTPAGPTPADHVARALIHWLTSNPWKSRGGGEGGPNPLGFSGSEGPKPISTIPFSRVPPVDLPEGTVAIRKVGEGPIYGGRVVFHAPANHHVYVRISRYLSPNARRCFVIKLPPAAGGKCVIGPDFDPLYILTAPTLHIPSPWLSCSPEEGKEDRPFCYFFDGLSYFSHLGWVLDRKLHYEKWELNAGYYYHLGFLDEGPTHPFFPPGDFCVEAVAVYYYEQKQYKMEGEPFVLP